VVHGDLFECNITTSNVIYRHTCGVVYIHSQSKKEKEKFQ
jgi:hypothetical protein